MFVSLLVLLSNISAYSSDCPLVHVWSNLLCQLRSYQWDFVYSLSFCQLSLSLAFPFPPVTSCFNKVCSLKHLLVLTIDAGCRQGTAPVLPWCKGGAWYDSGEGESADGWPGARPEQRASAAALQPGFCLRLGPPGTTGKLWPPLHTHSPEIKVCCLDINRNCKMILIACS